MKTKEHLAPDEVRYFKFGSERDKQGIALTPPIHGEHVLNLPNKESRLVFSS